MNVSELKTGMGFVTDGLPLEKAVLCGILFSGIEEQDTPKGRIQKVIFKRMNGGEEIAFFADTNGNLAMGHWIPYVDLVDACAFAKNSQEVLDWDRHNIEVAEENIARMLRVRATVLENMRNGTEEGEWDE